MPYLVTYLEREHFRRDPSRTDIIMTRIDTEKELMEAAVEALTDDIDRSHTGIIEIMDIEIEDWQDVDKLQDIALAEIHKMTSNQLVLAMFSLYRYTCFEEDVLGWAHVYNTETMVIMDCESETAEYFG